jgi:hypothetical protein
MSGATMGRGRLLTVGDWLAYFEVQSNRDLLNCWSIWGRETEREGSEREINAWMAVNMEMADRGLA